MVAVTEQQGAQIAQVMAALGAMDRLLTPAQAAQADATLRIKRIVVDLVDANGEAAGEMVYDPNSGPPIGAAITNGLMTQWVTQLTAARDALAAALRNVA